MFVERGAWSWNHHPGVVRRVPEHPPHLCRRRVRPLRPLGGSWGQDAVNVIVPVYTPVVVVVGANRVKVPEYQASAGPCVEDSTTC